MGMSSSQNTQQQSRLNRRSMRQISEINVTPMVDVMLVLLIVFMITAPLLTVGVRVDLPKSNAKPIAENDEPLVISIKADGALFIQETLTDENQLIPRLIAITQAKADQKIFIRADQNLNYGDVMTIMGKIAAAGFKRVALLTKQPDLP